MDFLVTPRYRKIYTVIFGVMATSVIGQFQNISTPENINFYLRIFYRIRKLNCVCMLYCISKLLIINVCMCVCVGGGTGDVDVSDE